MTGGTINTNTAAAVAVDVVDAVDRGADNDDDDISQNLLLLLLRRRCHCALRF